LEALPEAKLYQALDYIEFLESQYARTGSPEEVSGLQKLAERLEDGLRKRTLSPSSLREAFQLIAAADRVLSSVTEAGKEILADLQLSESTRPGGKARPGQNPQLDDNLRRDESTRGEAKQVAPPPSDSRARSALPAGVTRAKST
jgi:hypothetical protein